MSAQTRIRAEHDNISQLLLVLESHLALVNAREPFDAGVMLEALDYLIDYVQDFHRGREAEMVGAIACLSARHDAIQTSGAELYHRLDLVMRDETMNRAEVVRLGYAYCAELRRLMCIEERALSDASPFEPVMPRVDDTDDESAFRSRFEALTRRLGCDCAYEHR